MSRLCGYVLWLIGCFALFLGIAITFAALMSNHMEIKDSEGQARKPGFTQRVTVMDS